MENPVVGIVAEYNPFHLGHAHHLKATKARLPGAAVVAVLSSHFVQRGEPAFLDKWTRAEMALSEGVDLVLGLPTAFSCHQAGVFAAGALDVLWGTGLVTHLSFGVEDDGEDSMDTIVGILMHEPPGFKQSLRRHLEEGHSFVEARSLALEEWIPGAAARLRRPNNNLALAYRLHARRKGYPLRFLAVPRKGAAYHDPSFTEGLPSATAIRAHWLRGDRAQALEGLPPRSGALLVREADRGRVCGGPLPLWWALLRHILDRSTPEELRESAEMAEGLEHKLLKEARETRDYEQFLQRTVSRRYPRSRIQRLCVHLLLRHDHWFNRATQRLGPSWISVLGANGQGRELLRRMRQTASLPLFSRFACPPDAYSRGILALEGRAARLWESLVPGGDPEREPRSRPLMTGP